MQRAAFRLGGRNYCRLEKWEEFGEGSAPRRRREVRVTAPVAVRAVEPLAPAVLEALQDLPNGAQLPGHRAWLLATHLRFGEAMVRIERRPPPPAALAELWLWVVHLVIDMGSPPATTVRSYAVTVSRFLGWAAAEGIDFRRANTEAFDRWQRWLAIERKNGPTWRSQQVMALRNFYDWRRSRGLAQQNLAADLRGPKVKKKPAKKYTTDQLRALFRAIDHARPARAVRDRCIVLMLLTTGLRREEISALSLEDVELTRRTGVVRISGKGAKERDVPFEGPVVESIGKWLEYRAQVPGVDADALFVSLTGRNRGGRLTMDGHEAVIAQHARAANLRSWGMHRFRVTFATQLYDDGADIETIRALMGHESIETTRGYLAVSERARRTRLHADRQHSVLGTKPTGTPLWARLAGGGLSRE